MKEFPNWFWYPRAEGICALFPASALEKWQDPTILLCPIWPEEPSKNSRRGLSGIYQVSVMDLSGVCQGSIRCLSVRCLSGVCQGPIRGLSGVCLSGIYQGSVRGLSGVCLSGICQGSVRCLSIRCLSGVCQGSVRQKLLGESYKFPGEQKITFLDPTCIIEVKKSFSFPAESCLEALSGI